MLLDVLLDVLEVPQLMDTCMGCLPRSACCAGQQGVLLDTLEAPQLMDTCMDCLSRSACCAGQQGVLLDVLEAPQLMDTCVRNGNYDDALDLRAFVAKLLLIHPQLKVRAFRGQGSRISGLGCQCGHPAAGPPPRCALSGVKGLEIWAWLPGVAKLLLIHPQLKAHASGA